MIEGLDTIAGLSQDLLWISFVVFLRVGAMMSLMPGFGEQSVPQRIRLILAFCFSLIVIPALITQIPAQTDLAPLDVLRIIFVEVLAGLALGIAVRLFVLALQTSAAIAAQSTSLSQVFGGVGVRSEEHTSELQSPVPISYAVFCLKKKKTFYPPVT